MLHDDALRHMTNQHLRHREDEATTARLALEVRGSRQRHVRRLLPRLERLFAAAHRRHAFPQ